jgi:hypothetical protein
MAFIGTPLDTRNTFQSLQGKRFNGDGSTTAFTLDVAPSSTLDIEVFVGNVRQDPNSAYTLSGTTLTFTGAPPSGTNNIYVVHQAKSVGTIDPPATETIAKTFSGGVTLSGATTHSGALNVTGAFNSVGIDDNGDATTMTIDTSENVNIGDATNRGYGPLQLGNTSNNHAYMQMLSSVAGNIHFGDATSGDAREIGSIVYRHDTDSMLLKTSGATGLQIDSAGHITTPLQSGFVTTNSSSNSNVTGDETNYTMVFDSDIVDRNADHAHASGTFTAPVTGLYNFSCALSLGGIASNHTRLILSVETSNRIYYMKLLNINNSLHNSGSLAVGGAITADMDASDTAVFKLRIDGGSKVVDVDDASLASGFLIG